MEFKVGMKVRIAGTTDIERRDSIAHGTEGKTATVESVAEGYIGIQLDRPELGRWRDWHGSVPKHMATPVEPNDDELFATGHA